MSRPDGTIFPSSLLQRANSSLKLVMRRRQSEKIAEVSGIGMGTIFYYVREKRDFVYLIFNDQAEERLEKAFAALQPWQSFRAKLLSLAEPHYQGPFGLEARTGTSLP